MLKYTILLLTFFAPWASAAELRGRVIDPSGAGVRHAELTVISRDGSQRRSALADALGEFRLESLASGEYLIEAHAPGLTSAPQRVELSDNSNAVVLRLDLPHVATSVQVTGAAVAQSADESAKALDIMDSEQLERRAEISIAESLRNVPGLRVQQLGGPASFARVQARGMRSYDTSVLVDGFRLRDAAAAQGDAVGLLNELLLVDTDRIEVLRGSGASLYGSNAGAAVVNIVTYQGGGRLRGDVSAEGGGLGLLRGLARISGGALADRFRYSGGVSHLNITSGVDDQDRARNTGAHGSAQYSLTPGTLLSARVFASDAYLDLNDTPFPAPSLPPGIVRARPFITYTPALNDPDQQRISGYFSGLASLTQQIAPGASLRVSYQGLATRRDVRDGPAGRRFEPSFSNLSGFDGRIDTVQARADWQLTTSHLLTGGYEWEREAFENLSADENPTVSERILARATAVQKSQSVFLQDQVRLLADRLHLSLSGRLQDFDLNRPEFSGGAGTYTSVPPLAPKRAYTGDVSAAYLLRRSSTKLRAHVGNGYRAPSLYERFGTYFFGSFSPLGDPRLRPERLISADAGVDQYFANDRVRIRGTFFYTRIQEAIGFDIAGLITPANDPFGRFGGYWNTGGGLARGVEISVESRLTRSTTIDSSYTYTNADERESALAGGYLQSPRILDHMWAVLATQRIGRSIDVAFDLLAGSDYLLAMSQRAFRFDGPLKADLAAGYTRAIGDTASMRFYTRIENVFNRAYYEDGFPVPKAWATAGIKFIF